VIVVSIILVLTQIHEDLTMELIFVALGILIGILYCVVGLGLGSQHIPTGYENTVFPLFVVFWPYFVVYWACKAIAYKL